MTDNLSPNGPYETGRDAYEAARVLREQIGAATPGGDMTQAVISARSKARVQYLRGVLEVAGVELGAFDKRMVEWVASWDLETIQAIAGWIQRANPRHADEPNMHPWDAPDATALVDVRDESATVLHALPPINFPGRVAGVEPGPRCGGQGRTALLAADVTCPECIALMAEQNGDAR